VYPNETTLRPVLLAGIGVSTHSGAVASVQINGSASGSKTPQANHRIKHPGQGADRVTVSRVRLSYYNCLQSVFEGDIRVHTDREIRGILLMSYVEIIAVQISA
jgi:hypothetical protein